MLRPFFRVPVVDAGAGLAAAVHGAAAAADQHGELRSHAGHRRRPAAGLALPAPPGHRPAPGAHRADVRCRLQHGPSHALLVPLARRCLPGAGHEGAQNHPQESPHGPGGGIARPGRLVLPGHGHAGGAGAGGELGGAEGQILGVLQGRLVRVARGSAHQFPLRPPQVPGDLRQRDHAGLGHVPLLPQTQAWHPPQHGAQPAQGRDVKELLNGSVFGGFSPCINGSCLDADFS